MMFNIAPKISDAIFTREGQMEKIHWGLARIIHGKIRWNTNCKGTTSAKRQL